MSEWKGIATVPKDGTLVLLTNTLTWPVIVADRWKVAGSYAGWEEWYAREETYGEPEFWAQAVFADGVRLPRDR